MRIPCIKALQQSEDQALVDSKEYKMPELVKQIRLITQQFDGNSKSVAVSTSAPAPSLLNSLTSHGTDVLMEKESGTGKQSRVKGSALFPSACRRHGRAMAWEEPSAALVRCSTTHEH